MLILSFSCKGSGEEVKSADAPAAVAKVTLQKHTVMSEGHPMAVWEKKASDAKGVILFVHGRTWSGVPDFDLQVEGEELSLMDGMIEQGYSTYAVDLRGYGGTPRDSTEWLTPLKAAKDVNAVLKWIAEENDDKVHLFGWSMGSTVSLLASQQSSGYIKSLNLFGFWMDLDTEFPVDPEDKELEKRINTAEAAASDFITPGSISQKAIDTYVKMALEADPVRVDWRDMKEFEAIDPATIELPVLLIQGELDPIAPTDRQAKLFSRLKTADKSWAVISGGDHAAFMESPRPQFIRVFTDFINRFNK
ncbi:alpha/beta fold hydrolase [Leptobacterium flavescens]|uniref:Alpha/beta fold hydrolase n=2 Tax=Leptobacterium flavescens TaxID=472055 RepID=A0A6P0UNK1_9FLAO|nr:alpha/beta fold hydrolase [Leptobacterium flavescens]